MKIKIALLVLSFSITSYAWGQFIEGIPVEGKYRTKMGWYKIFNKDSYDFFSAVNLEQSQQPNMTQQQWALADVQNIVVSNVDIIANKIIDKYKVKQSSLYISTLINSQGEAVYVDFLVKKDYRPTSQSLLLITADELADIEYMVKNHTFIFHGNTYNLPYFCYGFYVNKHD